MASRAARLDLRLSPADKARIARAADVRGVPISSFVRDAVLREVESVLASETTVVLSAAESHRFLEAVDAPFRPNGRLEKALSRVAAGSAAGSGWTDEEIADLVRRGILRPPTQPGPLPREILSSRTPRDANGAVAAALIDERRRGR